MQAAVLYTRNADVPVYLEANLMPSGVGSEKASCSLGTGYPIRKSPLQQYATKSNNTKIWITRQESPQRTHAFTINLFTIQILNLLNIYLMKNISDQSVKMNRLRKLTEYLKI